MNFSLKSIIRKINAENIDKAMKSFNKGMKTFDKIMADFGNSMDQLTKEINQTSQNNIKIWSDDSEKVSKLQKSKDQKNLEKIWGNKNE
jgi:hypothetical protein